VSVVRIEEVRLPLPEIMTWALYAGGTSGNSTDANAERA
jgi:hypothetical protein